MIGQAEQIATALVGLAEHGIPADVQELLVRGDPARRIPPGALSKVLASSRADGMRAAVEICERQAEEYDDGERYLAVLEARDAITACIDKEQRQC